MLRFGEFRFQQIEYCVLACSQPCSRCIEFRVLVSSSFEHCVLSIECRDGVLDISLCAHVYVCSLVIHKDRHLDCLVLALIYIQYSV